jgi:hypothetical protein
MPEYRLPSPVEMLSGKWVVVGDRIVVTQNHDFKTGHDDLAKEEKLFDDLFDRVYKDPGSVNAGTYISRGEERTVTVSFGSVTLGLPLRSHQEAANTHALKVIGDQSPGFTVKIG